MDFTVFCLSPFAAPAKVRPLEPCPSGFLDGSCSPNLTPAALALSDWQDIKTACESSRHAILSLPDSRHAARNPGQGWITEFDGRGNPRC